MTRRNVLITGGSRGIGAAIAREFAKAGDRIAVHYVSSKADAENVKTALQGEGHLTAQADLRDPEAIRNMVEHVAQDFGRIDVLINNAGVFVDHPIESTTYEEWQNAWEQTIGINLIGAANVTWCALQHMPKNGTSRIVNIGSRGAFRGEPLNPAYGASKAGIVAFGQSIAKALAPMHIGVTTLAPGFVETEMAAILLDGPVGDEIRGQSPFNRVAKPDELAKAVYFLASADSEWASGAVLDFNGASYLRM
ncbi:MAG: SDR family NAD(P)-dependent oxidoreductase [Actinobacteria bacterium]|nr:SDR family NAD(P)-dependent oxidoreductase [Actinomycetota bacterium]